MSPAIAAMAMGLRDDAEESASMPGPQPYGYWLARAYCLHPELAPYGRTQYEEGFLFAVLSSIQARRDRRYA